MTSRAPRSILITGASSGLGAALADLYAGPGITLALHGRDQGRLTAIAERARAKGANVTTFSVDIRDHMSLHQHILELDQHMPFDLVIANAGISGGPRDGLESAEQIKMIFDVNVGGVMNTLAPLVPRMMARGCGQIAIMASLAAFAPWPSAPAYAASKACVKTYGLALRTALRTSGVRVNVICPGFVDTPMTRINPYPMPFLMDAPRAAHIIKKGLAQNRALMAFPWQTALIARMIGILPIMLQAKILGYAPAKPDVPAAIISR